MPKYCVLYGILDLLWQTGLKGRSTIMNCLKKTKKISCYLFILLLFSCFSAPVEININKKIKIDEDIYKSHINNLRKEIIKQLNSNKTTCVNSFSGWLEKHFLEFRIPRRVVSANEYASGQAALAQCPDIDLEKEVPKAWRALFKEGKIKLVNIIFNIDNLREKLEKTACIKELIDPKNNNLMLRSIKTKVSGNSLNFDIPVFRIYYAIRKIEEEEINDPNAESKLLASGAIKLLGATRAYKSGNLGFQDFDFVPDPKEYRAALKTLQELSANLIAFPQGLGEEPQVSLIENESYFIIPKGEAELNINLDLLISMSLSKIGCVLKIIEEI